MNTSVSRALGVGVAALIAVSADPAGAQSLSASVSCLHGEVAPNDYAELGQQIKEYGWDQKGGVTLVASVGGLRLKVLDPNGLSVCEETANNATLCTFKIGFASVPEFTIIADNANVGVVNNYRICAY
ncbi:MAG: hypothetical protein SFW09_04470 [Hyphomicrobiaceae bacterium]|nr:hypothetical protein [Hyphomicrobiaceae bacterium]